MTGYSMGAAARVGRKEGIVIQTIRRLRTNSTAMFGLIVLALLILLSVFAPVIAPYHYTEMDMLQLNAAPSLKHFFGTDSLGRDILSRLIYGGRYSIFLGISSSVLSMAAAIVLGSLAGYFGGWVDNVVLRICDVVQAIPGILLSIVISAVLGPGFFNTILALAIGGIPSGIRLTRAQILSVRSEEYLEAAASVNCSSMRIMFRHILPNILSPLIVGFTMGIGNTIMLASSLSFIGLGVQPPAPEWGAMLSAGRDFIRNYPWQIIFPGIFVFVTVLSINLFGDGLRDALDPKMKK
ncbi:MAG: ABC transporter permease [Hungatella hathewayi]|uniref:ABC transporter permease n=1 Tax=Hungatella TaxID=1649459 RepID=UPI00110739DB|nr:MULTISPECIES: ABC transporter permease [Hungatella]MCD7967804.1 ABC transporter permease [Clostridiaceae bacterium]MCI7383427.1 ABC transporter permease [Hungatella sp.]MDY6235899.1 ABC transporter permease [Hungatella hathewayi]